MHQTPFEDALATKNCIQEGPLQSAIQKSRFRQMAHALSIRCEILEREAEEVRYRWHFVVNHGTNSKFSLIVFPDTSIAMH